MPPPLTVLRAPKWDFGALLPFPALPWIPTEFLLDFLLEEFHFLGLPVHQEHIPGLGLPDQLHDALGVGVGAEGHVLHLHLHLQLGRSREQPQKTGNSFGTTPRNTQIPLDLIQRKKEETFPLFSCLNKKPS